MPLLRPLVFTVLFLGLEPRLALQRADGGEARFEKIIEYIRSARFGIHDISRCQAERKGELFRLNMPFELGLDIGCKEFSTGKWRRKRCLIFEAERYRYQAALSDLSNSDIIAHFNEPEEVVRGVRNWLIQEASAQPVSTSRIWGAFSDFMAENYIRLRKERYSRKDIKLLPVSELITQMKQWIRVAKTSSVRKH